jgi:hypothetical protein
VIKLLRRWLAPYPTRLMTSVTSLRSCDCKSWVYIPIATSMVCCKGCGKAYAVGSSISDPVAKLTYNERRA